MAATPTETTNLMVDPLLIGRTDAQDDDESPNSRTEWYNASHTHAGGLLAETSPPMTPDNNNNNNNVNTAFRTPQSQNQQPPHRPTPEYDPDDHFRILFQVYGSVWPQVLPQAVAILVFTAAVFYLRDAQIVDLTIANNTGHSFMSLLVSFLIVTRATVVYGRFMQARQHLADLFRTSREVVHHACLLTACNTNAAAVKWRRQVAYRTILMLRVATAAMQYRSHGVTAWETLPDEEHAHTPLFLRNDSIEEESLRRYQTSHNAAVTEQLHGLMHGPRTAVDESFRAPFVLALNLRQEVLATRPRPDDQDENASPILPQRPMHPNEELKILAFIADMTTAYNNAKKLITTPFPFPLVQMCYTFTLFWVWSLPLVIIGDNDKKTEVFLLLFFLSYGFLGLEYVNRELDDPYGTDANDFHVNRWEAMVQEDCYICLLKTDGYESAKQLRAEMDQRISHGNALENYRKDIQRNSFWNLAADTLGASLQRVSSSRED